MAEKYQNKYRITSARLKNWDYASCAAYFITICTANREHFLGEIIGGKMIVESVKPDKEDDEVKEMDAPLDLKEMFVLAVATSIDALAVGITFAFLDYPIVEAITIIGISTFFISIGGVYVGNFFGNKYEKKAEFAGGLILVLLGVRILLTHLGIL